MLAGAALGALQGNKAIDNANMARQANITQKRFGYFSGNHGVGSIPEPSMAGYIATGAMSGLAAGKDFQSVSAAPATGATIAGQSFNPPQLGDSFLGKNAAPAADVTSPSGMSLPVLGAKDPSVSPWLGAASQGMGLGSQAANMSSIGLDQGGNSSYNQDFGPPLAGKVNPAEPGAMYSSDGTTYLDNGDPNFGAPLMSKQNPAPMQSAAVQQAANNPQAVLQSIYGGPATHRAAPAKPVNTLPAWLQMGYKGGGQ